MSAQPAFSLRLLTIDDAPAVAAMMAGDPNAFMNTHYLKDAFTVITQATEHETIGVAAVVNGEVVGAATVSFGKAQFEGKLVPFGMLHTLIVSPAHRGMGIGKALVKWRVDYAREKCGERCLLISGTSSDNHASLALMKTWYSDIIERISTRITSVRRSPPRPMWGVTVRDITPHEYAEYAAKQNAFHADYNLYEPLSAAEIERMLAHQPGDVPMFRFIGVFNEAGEMIAGASTRFRGSLVYDRINHPPRFLRVLNFFMRMFPSDYTMRDYNVIGLWYLDGQEHVIPHLWETLRFLCSEHGSMMMTTLDALSPLESILPAQRFMPKPALVTTLRGPVPMNPDRLHYITGRR